MYTLQRKIFTFTYLELVSKITYLADASNATQATRTLYQTPICLAKPSFNKEQNKAFSKEVVESYQCMWCKQVYHRIVCFLISARKQLPSTNNLLIIRCEHAWERHKERERERDYNWVANKFQLGRWTKVYTHSWNHYGCSLLWMVMVSVFSICQIKENLY